MGDTGEGTVEAGAEVPTGTEAMKTALMEVAITEGMMTGITMKVGAGNTVPPVQAVEVGALVVEGTAALLGKEVKRDVQKLNSGTERGKRLNVVARQFVLVTRITGVNMTTMSRIMPAVRRHHSRLLMGIDDYSTGLFSLPFFSYPN